MKLKAVMRIIQGKPTRPMRFLIMIGRTIPQMDAPDVMTPTASACRLGRAENARKTAAVLE